MYGYEFRKIRLKHDTNMLEFCLRENDWNEPDGIFLR